MRITARVDYAVRAALELAAAAPEALTAERIATAQNIPVRFLQAILRDLQGARLVTSQRGREGGYRLALPGVGDLHRPRHARRAGLPRRRARRAPGGPRLPRAAARARRASGSPPARPTAGCSSRSRSPTSSPASCPHHVAELVALETPGARSATTPPAEDPRGAPARDTGRHVSSAAPRRHRLPDRPLGAGKSTIADALVAELEADGRPVTVLDGDVVRTHLSSELTFSREHRDLNIRRIGWVAGEVVKHGGTVVVAAIAPYEAAREEARALVEKHGRFVLVHLSTPLEVCEQRDVKGLYAKARAGEIPEFTGISDPYEPPARAEVVDRHVGDAARGVRGAHPRGDGRLSRIRPGHAGPAGRVWHHRPRDGPRLPPRRASAHRPGARLQRRLSRSALTPVPRAAPPRPRSAAPPPPGRLPRGRRAQEEVPP